MSGAAAQQPEPTMLEHALAYLAMGLPIFSVCGILAHRHKGKDCDNRGKVPLVEWKKYQTELPTVAEVTRMFRDKQNVNIGMATGALSRIVVVDLDGELAIREATARGFGNGPHVLTGRVGGMHRYFQYRADAPRNFAKTRGIDFRGQGGYVVLPPSRHASGRTYTWGEILGDIDDLPALPEWVDEVAKDSGSRGPRDSSDSTAPLDIDDLITNGAPHGERSDTAWKLASKLRGEDYPRHAAESLMRAFWRACPQVEGNPFELETVLDMVERAYAQYEPNDDPERVGEVTARARANGAASTSQGAEDDAAPSRPTPSFPMDVLPEVLRKQVEHNVAHGLPAAFGAGAGLATAAIAVGARSELRISSNQVQRAVIWTPLMGSRGSGKTPSQDIVMDPLRVRNSTLAESDAIAQDVWRQMTPKERAADPSSAPRNHTFLAEDATLEALARLLADEPGVSFDLDELTVLNALGEYKGGAQTGDVPRLLKLWNGRSWSYVRVGGGGTRTNGVSLFIPKAVCSIVGGIQPELHAQLGGDVNGLRPRWLPHLASTITTVGEDDYAYTLDSWKALINELLKVRHQARVWIPTTEMIKRFRHWGRVWKKAAADPSESSSASAFLLKGETHLQRIVLVSLEMEPPEPRAGDLIARDIDLVDRCATWVEYCADCWRALGESESLALSTRDERLDRGVLRLRAWLNEHGGHTTARDIKRLSIAGANTAEKRDALVAHYGATYPGCVTTTLPAGGGPLTTRVRSPDITP